VSSFRQVFSQNPLKVSSFRQIFSRNPLKTRAYFPNVTLFSRNIRAAGRKG
jgi:hypothetical protein